jgi:hypothetical protein
LQRKSRRKRRKALTRNWSGKPGPPAASGRMRPKYDGKFLCVYPAVAGNSQFKFMARLAKNRAGKTRDFKKSQIS